MLVARSFTKQATQIVIKKNFNILEHFLAVDINVVQSRSLNIPNKYIWNRAIAVKC